MKITKVETHVLLAPRLRLRSLFFGPGRRCRDPPYRRRSLRETDTNPWVAEAMIHARSGLKSLRENSAVSTMPHIPGKRL